MEILRATTADLDEVLALHERYNISSIRPEDKPDGFTTAKFTPEQLHELVELENGITIAKDGDHVISYAMVASWQFWSSWPIFAYMIEKLPENSLNGQVLSVNNSYQYGPICVDKPYRNSGVFEKVFYASLDSMTSRYPIMVTFINQINHRSYAAHTKKVAVDTIGTFQFNQNNYYILACKTKPLRNAR